MILNFLAENLKVIEDLFLKLPINVVEYPNSLTKNAYYLFWNLKINTPS